MIDAAQGSQRKVNEIGENVKQYYESVSGSASFMKRVEHAHLQRDKQVVPKVPQNMKYQMLPIILAQASSFNHYPPKS